MGRSLGRKKLTRREFLETTAAAAAAIAASPLLGSKFSLSSVSAAPKNFSGVTVTVAVGSFMTPGAAMFKGEWEKRTGGKINIVEIPFGDLYQKLFSSFTGGVEAYDVAIYASNWIPDFAKDGHIISLEKYYPEKDNWNSVLPQVQRIMYVKGQRYSVPMDGDVIFGYYRKDALENAEYQKRFQDKYGYPLRLPKTWKEYRDVAQFFSGWDWAKSGKPGFGVLEAMKPKDVGPYIYVTHAACYSAYPGDKGGFWFDPDTMEPLVNNPGWVRAVEEWNGLKPFGPPEMITWGGGEMRGNYVAGNYALGIDWADVGIMAQDETKSIIKGKLGYFLAPGSTEVYNREKARWETFKEIQYAPYQGWGGWHASVTARSKHPDAAWDFANYIDSTPNALRAVTTPGTARNPYRIDHFDPKNWVTAPVHYKDPEQYLEVQRKALTHTNSQLDLRIPRAGRYVDTLDKWVQLALSGQMSAKEALNKCKDEWASITKEIGLKSQLEFYRSLYGLK